MKNTPLRILFFTPYAGRTGSEMMLLYILKNLDRGRFHVGLVSFSDGELLREVPSGIPVFIAPHNYNIWQKASNWAGYNPTKYYLEYVQNKFKADLWYINTIMLPEAVLFAKQNKIPFITHVHEMPEAYSSTGKVDLKYILEDSAMLIGCSNIACQRLYEAGGREIKRVYSFVDVSAISADAEISKSIRSGWGANDGDYVWIFSGVSSDLKGFGLLPDIATQVKAKNVHLVWMGKLLDTGLVQYVEARCSHITNVKIHFVGPKSKNDYYNHLAAADGLVMASRQESFGLVMVEAAWLGKPVVAFDSGGPSEFITPDIGTIVPNMNIEKLVEEMDCWQRVPEKYDYQMAHETALRFSAAEGMKEWDRAMEEYAEGDVSKPTYH
jgi:glycosyltransferase involved in cell wall biosynthesis